MYFKEISAKMNINSEVHKVFNLMLEKLVEHEDSDNYSKDIKISRFELK